MSLMSLDHMRENLPVMISISASDNSLNTDENIELIMEHTKNFYALI